MREKKREESERDKEEGVREREGEGEKGMRCTMRPVDGCMQVMSKRKRKREKRREMCMLENGRCIMQTCSLRTPGTVRPYCTELGGKLGEIR